MKKGTGTAITFALGVFAGQTLCGPAAQAATNLTATLSNQPIYVDGQRVSMTAYQIGGNNYVKLRDVGEAVGFNVYWDGSAVQVESGKPYTGVGPVSQTYPTQPVQQAIPAQQTTTAPTEESVQAALRALREQYPNNTAWPAPYHSTSGGPYGTTISNCAGWAILCSVAAFGNLPWRRVNNPTWDQIRAGDLVEYSNPQGRHVVVVVSKTDDSMAITDSGTTQKAYWGGKYFRYWLEEQPGLTLYTRYPS